MNAFLAALAEQAADCGLAGLRPQDLRYLLAEGSRQGVSAVLLGVLADRREPEVARLRALSRVLVALERETGPVQGYALAAPA